MHLLSTLLFGLSANLDNLGIGVSFGIQRIRIPFFSNFFIALLSGVVAYVSVFAGQALSHFIGWASILGSLILIAIGVWVGLHKPPSHEDLPHAVPATKMYTVSFEPYPLVFQVIKSPSKADLDANGFISMKESVALGLSLSLNCIATGLGAGLVGLAPFPVALSVILFSMLTISIGYIMGWKAMGRFHNWSQVLAGLLLIAIGIYELLK